MNTRTAEKIIASFTGNISSIIHNLAADIRADAAGLTKQFTTAQPVRQAPAANSFTALQQARELVYSELSGQRGAALGQQLMANAFAGVARGAEYLEALKRESSDVPESLGKEKAFYNLWHSVIKTQSDSRKQDYEKQADMYFAGGKYRLAMDRLRQQPRAAGSAQEYTGVLAAYGGYMGVYDPQWQKYASDVRSHARYETAVSAASADYRRRIAAGDPDAELIKNARYSAAGWDYMASRAESSRRLQSAMAKEAEKNSREYEEYMKSLISPFTEKLSAIRDWAMECSREAAAHNQQVLDRALTLGTETNSLYSRGQLELGATSAYSLASPVLTRELIEAGMTADSRHNSVQNTDIYGRDMYRLMADAIEKGLKAAGDRTEESYIALKGLWEQVSKIAAQIEKQQTEVKGGYYAG